jgi:hypothetical protein
MEHLCLVNGDDYGGGLPVAVHDHDMIGIANAIDHFSEAPPEIGD